MEKEKTDGKNPITSRSRFIIWTATALASLTVFRFLLPSKKKAKPETVKMLGRDGKLVEVDASLLQKSKGKKIKDKELQSWVKR